MLGVAAVFSAFTGAASYLEGRKAAKNAEKAGEFNRVSNLVNGQIEAERTRFNATQLKFQSLIASEDFKIKAATTRANQKLAKVEGTFRANQSLFRADRISRDAAQQNEDLARQNLGITREKKQAQSIFGRSVEFAYLQNAREKARVEAQLASMGVSINAGMSQAIAADIQLETEKTILGLNDEILVRERAANTATTKNIKSIERITTAANEESSFAKQQAELIGITVDATDVILDLEAANLVAQADYMKWNAEFVEDSAELSAQVLEMGGEL